MLIITNKIFQNDNFFSFHPELLNLPLDKAATKIKIPNEVLFRLSLNYRFDEETTNWFNEYLNIKNSEQVFYSHDVNNSTIIVDSLNVSDSRQVRESENIENSSTVLRSADITNSEKIANSSYVVQSAQIINSSNITKSVNIIDSIFVNNSKNLFKCKDTFDSSFLRLCESTTNCYFCTKCNNITNSAFCYDLSNTEDTDYYLFNKKITKQRFEVVENYIQNLKEQEPIYFNWPEDFTLSYEPKIILNHRKHFNLSPNFYKWLETLPNYTEEIWYAITTLI